MPARKELANAQSDARRTTKINPVAGAKSERRLLSSNRNGCIQSVPGGQAMTVSALAGFIAIVLIAPHLTKREAVVIMFLNFFIGVVLLAYEVFK